MKASRINSCARSGFITHDGLLGFAFCALIAAIFIPSAIQKQSIWRGIVGGVFALGALWSIGSFLWACCGRRGERKEEPPSRNSEKDTPLR